MGDIIRTSVSVDMLRQDLQNLYFPLVDLGFNQNGTEDWELEIVRHHSNLLVKISAKMFCALTFVLSLDNLLPAIILSVLEEVFLFLCFLLLG